ncbi:AraC family transcriptional regulator [Clostridium sp. chh4-2]|uniref:AraC family transcriptional regulator n=1 Tax=Clostridium sp. chh4-2 TaxID=2067550 RepID=UPI000CCDEEF0|nr:AraC family transcriptional regulator [Clostridium sp. chh4-2]PNV59765.1 AraC family transcriptional regulator [Clostridium sp. chh4-2]
MEAALISKQFIEALTEVPAAVCENRLEDMEVYIKQYIPDFLKQNFPFFITETMAESFQPRILYHITDFIGLNFTFFLVEETNQLFLIGPYLLNTPDNSYCEQILQENNLNLSLLLPLYQYYMGMPIATNSTMLEAARTAMKVITHYEENIPYQHYQPQAKHNREVANLSPEGYDEAMMELLEQRYRMEKMMLQEVRQGNSDLALKYYRLFSQYSRSIVRTEDPIRTAKNLGFSLNTMLRKSAELAGIHPVYLDIISSNFAMLIENSNNLKELDEFKFQMISAYCRFVQKHRLDQYSPLVRKAITYIHVRLADPLTLGKIADGIKVSSSYLSKLFNEEVGKSISNYITEARIQKAAELLSFTRMPIQNVSGYVGFSDLNYFSRCFKKYMGMTPSEYRGKESIGVH